MFKFKILCFILTGFVLGCSNNSETPDNPYINFLTSGTWRIDLYTHDAVDITTPGINSTQDYLNYVIKFNPNGTILATKGNEIINGNWVFKFGNFETTTNQLILTFNGNSAFTNLSNVWYYYGNSPDEINLKIDFKDFLTFKR